MSTPEPRAGMTGALPVRPGPAAKTRWALRLCFVSVTVLVLAFSCGQLFASWSVLDRDPDTISIEAREDSDETPRQLWITDIVVEGQLLRPELLSQISGWQVDAKRGDELPRSVRFEHGSTPSILTFRARRFLLVVASERWQGTIRVTRNGGEAQVVDLHDSGGTETALIEDPVAPLTATMFIVAAVLFGGAAIGLGAARCERRSVWWLILFLVVLHLVVWAGQTIGTTNDSPGYLDSAPRLLLQGAPDYFPPGYPALVGLVGLLSGNDVGRWVAFVQHILAVISGLWIYSLLRRIVWYELAILGGLLVATLAPVVTLSQTVMSEVPALFAMVGALYFAVRSEETGRRRYAMLSGALTGWAGLLRVVPLAALLPAITIVHLRSGATRGLGRIALAVTTAAAVVLLPIFWFWYMTGQPMLATSTGVHLFDRVVTEQRLFDEDGTASRALLEALHGENPRELVGWEVQLKPGLMHLSEAESARVLLAVSLEAIEKHPWTYLSFIPGLALRILVADPRTWIPAWGDTEELDARLETPALVAPSAGSLRARWRSEALHGALWPALCFVALVGTVCGLWLPQRNLVLAMAWMPIGYLSSTAAIEFFSPRYNVPIIPFVVALAIVPIGIGLSAAFDRAQPRL